jgi:type III secretory pathway component EscU
MNNLEKRVPVTFLESMINIIMFVGIVPGMLFLMMTMIVQITHLGVYPIYIVVGMYYVSVMFRSLMHYLHFGLTRLP